MARMQEYRLDLEPFLLAWSETHGAMALDVELQSLVGTQIMSAVSALSAMGFRCRDISRQAIHPVLKPAGTFLCTAGDDKVATTQPLSILLPFSEQGVVIAVIPNAPGSQA